MQIIVNDTSCLIDLRKAGLLHATLLLPYVFLIALPLLRSELVGFTKAEVDDLCARGLTAIDLPGEGVKRALDLRRLHPVLSINDCLSMALAESQPGCVLLTGDRSLRTRAAEVGIEVHGVLWVCDQLENGNVVSFASLHDGLSCLHSDPLVFVPKDEVEQRMARLAKLLKRGTAE
jgi:hypothetical protein